jgi:Uncharacterised protein family (UPF0158)
VNTQGPAGDDDGTAALRPLAIDLDELTWALTSHDDFMGSSHWLNLDTGEVVFVGDPADVGALAETPEDPRDNDRYMRIEAIDSSQSFRIMEDFVVQLADRRLAQTLERALQQRKPFRHFKDELAGHPAQRQDWFAFERSALERIARRWCADCGIEPQWTTRGQPPP